MLSIDVFRQTVVEAGSTASEVSQITERSNMFPRSLLRLGRGPIVRAVAVLLIGASAARAQDATVIRYRWAAGDVIRQRMTTEFVSKTTGGSTGAMDMNATQICTTRMTVKAVDAEGAATMDWVLDSIQIDKTQPGQGRVQYDSTKPEAATALRDSVVELMAAMVGESVTTIMAPDGSVRDVRGFERIADKMAKARQGQAGGAVMAGMLKRSTASALKQIAGSCSYTCPPGPVKRGDVWDREREVAVPMAGTMKMVIRSTFTGLEEDHGASTAKVDSTGTIGHEPHQGGDHKTPMATDSKTPDMTTVMETWFDVAKGRLRKSIMKSDTTVDMPTGKGPEAGKMHVVCTTRMTIEDLGDEGATK
jgi:hypothetical protein